MTSVGDGVEAAAGMPRKSFGVASSDEVLVYYLAVEAHRDGFRWAVRRFGSGGAVRVGPETFASEIEARKTGRPALTATCAAGRLMRRRASKP